MFVLGFSTEDMHEKYASFFMFILSSVEAIFKGQKEEVFMIRHMISLKCPECDLYRTHRLQTVASTVSEKFTKI